LKRLRCQEIELSEYCRSKGLYPQQVKAWKAAMPHRPARAKAKAKRIVKQAKADQEAHPPVGSVSSTRKEKGAG